MRTAACAAPGCGRTALWVMWLLGGVAVRSAAAQVAGDIGYGLTFSTAHDDNVFSTTQPIADVLAVLRPSLDARVESPRVVARGLGSFDMQRTVRSSIPASLGLRRHGEIDVRATASPTLAIGVEGVYDYTEIANDLTRDTGLLLFRQRASRARIVPSVQYRLGAHAQLTAEYGWTRQVLAGSFANRADAAQVTFAREQSVHSGWHVRYVTRRFADAVLTRQSHTGVVGASRALGSHTTIAAEVGPRAAARGGLQPEVAATLARRVTPLRWRLDYWRGESNVLGIVGPVEIHSGTGRASVLVLPRIELGGAVGIFNTRSIAEATANVYHASTSGSWTFEPFTVTATYGFDLQRGQLGSAAARQLSVQRRVFVVSIGVVPRRPSRVMRTDDGDAFERPLLDRFP